MATIRQHCKAESTRFSIVYNTIHSFPNNTRNNYVVSKIFQTFCGVIIGLSYFVLLGNQYNPSEVLLYCVDISDETEMDNHLRSLYQHIMRDITFIIEVIPLIDYPPS